MDNVAKQLENSLNSFAQSKKAIEGLPLEHPRKKKIIQLLTEIEQAAKDGNEEKLKELQKKVMNVSNL